MTKKQVFQLVMSFVVGCFLCGVYSVAFGQSDEEREALQEINRLHGTNYEWCDEAYTSAKSYADWMNTRGKMGHQSNAWDYRECAYQGTPSRHVASSWYHSSGHRHAIQNGWASGHKGAAVAFSGKYAGFHVAPFNYVKRYKATGTFMGGKKEVTTIVKTPTKKLKLEEMQCENGYCSPSGSSCEGGYCSINENGNMTCSSGACGVSSSTTKSRNYRMPRTRAFFGRLFR